MHDGTGARDAASGVGPGAPWWHDRRAQPLVAAGIVLVASGLVHAVVWGVAGGPWEGPVTWRKPILFGISGGLTCLSLGWAWALVPWRRFDSALATGVAAALVVEVAAIDLQRWRGVASHFNRQTPFDSFLYDMMGVLILFVSAMSLDLAVRSFRPRAGVDADMLLALRAGLIFLVVSCGLGIWGSVHGDRQMAAGLPPEIYGASGVVKFPHGAVIHALQWLPLLAFAARWAGLAAGLRTLLVAMATAGTALVAGYSLAQTLAGRPRFAASPPAALAVLVAGVACLAVPALLVAIAAAGRAVRPQA
jgi:hypothetical protein